MVALVTTLYRRKTNLSKEIGFLQSVKVMSRLRKMGSIMANRIMGESLFYHREAKTLLMRRRDGTWLGLYHSSPVSRWLRVLSPMRVRRMADYGSFTRYSGFWAVEGSSNLQGDIFR